VTEETKKSMQKKHPHQAARSRWSKILGDYGMLGVLLILCLLFSVLTLREQSPTGSNAAEKLMASLKQHRTVSSGVLIVARVNGEDSLFANTLNRKLKESSIPSRIIFSSEPSVLRDSLNQFASRKEVPRIIATSRSFSAVIGAIVTQLKDYQSSEIVTPPTYRWPTFLLADNLRNVANQITVIAIIAIGMTIVIITAGIDLSVGSLIALSAVVTAWIVGHMGGASASTLAVLIAGLGGILVCAATGAFSGVMITGFGIPPFIATLSMMQVAAGFAYIISQGKPIYQLPEGFILLGRGADPLFNIPYAVILMIVLYVLAHIVMTRTTIGRYIYAVGGNPEAARLSGIRVKLILFWAYVICGLLAGLGGVIMASQLKSGAPTYGLTYELYVIAAVVVGGTSLMGGEGRISGTLIGAFIIAVIQNGMNLTNVESYTQKVVLGGVILAAVLLDRLKQRGFRISG